MDARIRKVIKYLEENLDKKITLGDIAQIANLSVSHFSMLFKKETKKCYSQYLREKRLQRAKKLLKINSFSIKQVAHRVGYRNHSNFDHDFKKKIGVSPQKYKNEPHLSSLIRNAMRLVHWLFMKIVKFTNRIEKPTK